MNIFKKIAKTAIVIVGMAGLSQAVERCNTFNANMKEDYNRWLFKGSLAEELLSIIEEVHKTDVSCLSDLTNYTTIEGVDSPENSLHKRVAGVFKKGAFADFYVPYPNGNFINNWGSKKIHSHLGLGVFVNLNKYKAERMVPQRTNYERLNNRCILLKLTEKLLDNQASEIFYFLGVHLCWENPTKGKDVYASLAGELSDLRSRLKAPLLVSGEFSREVKRLSVAISNSKVLSVDSFSCDNGTLVLY